MQTSRAPGELVVQPGTEGAPSPIHVLTRERGSMDTGQTTRDADVIPSGLVPWEGSQTVQLAAKIMAPGTEEGGVIFIN